MSKHNGRKTYRKRLKEFDRLMKDRDFDGLHVPNDLDPRAAAIAKWLCDFEDKRWALALQPIEDNAKL